MNKEKQIEEMAKVIDEKQKGGWKFVDDSEYTTDVYNSELAKHLIDKGYRKASEVAREVISEVETVFDQMIEEAADQVATARLEYDLKAVKAMEYGINVLHLAYHTLKKLLKKKYESEGEG